MTSVRANRSVDSDTSGGGDQGKAPALVTVQSLATFPGAALAITIVWRFFDAVAGVQTRLVPVISAFVVGAILYAVALNGNMSRQDKLIALVIAIVNAMYLALSVLGIDVGLGSVGGEEASVSGVE